MITSSFLPATSANVAPAAPTTPGSSGSSASTLGGSLSPANIQQQFLSLLVAQLQNQDPLSPQDPTQFLTQLTSINSVEQLVQVNQQLTTIQGDLTASQASSGTGSSGAASSGSGSSTSGTKPAA